MGEPGKDVAAVRERTALHHPAAIDSVGPEAIWHSSITRLAHHANGSRRSDHQDEPVGAEGAAPHVVARPVTQGQVPWNFREGRPALLEGPSWVGHYVRELGKRRE